MNYQTIQERLAAFPQNGERPQHLIIWQDEPEIVGLKWNHDAPNPDFAGVRKALKGLPIEERLMPPGDDPAYVYLRIYDALEGGR